MQTTRPLIVDIDSTIWDPFPEIKKAAMEVAGVELVYEETAGYSLEDKVGGVEPLTEIFRRALHPRGVMKRKLYPGCAESLRAMIKNYGVELHFVSHNDYPEAMTPAVWMWLKRSLGHEDFTLKIGKTEELNKVDYAMEEGAMGIIDDKPATLQEAYHFFVGDVLLATKAHPWTKDIVEKTDGFVREFNSWFHAVGMVGHHVAGLTKGEESANVG